MRVNFHFVLFYICKFFEFLNNSGDAGGDSKIFRMIYNVK